MASTVSGTNIFDRKDVSEAVLTLGVRATEVSTDEKLAAVEILKRYSQNEEVILALGSALVDFGRRHNAIVRQALGEALQFAKDSPVADRVLIAGEALSRAEKAGYIELTWTGIIGKEAQ